MVSEMNVCFCVFKKKIEMRHILILLVVAVAMSAVAMPVEPDTVAMRKKVAVVLSGGGAFGAIHVGALKVLEETGIPVDGVVSSALLINIFEKNTPLHDGAVIMQGGRVVAATCYLPLSGNPDINKAYGTRHRAAIGISEATDSLTIVVSEETGAISIAVGGEMKHNLTAKQLRTELEIMEQRDETTAESSTLLGRIFSGRRSGKLTKSDMAGKEEPQGTETPGEETARQKQEVEHED